MLWYCIETNLLCGNILLFNVLNASLRPDLLKQDVLKLQSVNRTFEPSLMQVKENERDYIIFVLKGDLPVHYEGRTRMVKIKVEIPSAYPLHPPKLYILPAEGYKLKNDSDRIMLSCLDSWKYESTDLNRILKHTMIAFGNQFPLLDRNIQIPHEENTLLFNVPLDPILKIVNLLNSHKDLFVKKSTASYFSIAKMDENGQILKRFRVDYKLDFPNTDYIQILDQLRPETNLILDAEPMSIHLQCNNLQVARMICSVSLKCGYNNTGILYAKSGNAYLMIKSGDNLRIPLTTSQSSCLIPNICIPLLVEQAHLVLTRDVRRANEFRENL